MSNTINEVIAIEVGCPFCGKTSIIKVPVDGFFQWRCGASIQDAFPNLSVDIREQLVSGICPSCWDDTFSDNDEDEQENWEDVDWEDDDWEEDYDDCDYEAGFDPYMGCFTDDC